MAIYESDGIQDMAKQTALRLGHLPIISCDIQRITHITIFAQRRLYCMRRAVGKIKPQIQVALENQSAIVNTVIYAQS